MNNYFFSILLLVMVKIKKLKELQVPKSVLLVILIAMILFISARGVINSGCSHVATFILIICVIFVITNNYLYSIIYGLIIWGLLFVIRRNYLGLNILTESFENVDDEHPDEDKKDRKKYLKKIIKKLEGGISLKNEDLYEKNNLGNHNFSQNKESKKDIENSLTKKDDDLKPYEAQRQTYNLIDTVQQLKETVSGLGPMLKEGKTILEQLEHLKV